MTEDFVRKLSRMKFIILRNETCHLKGTEVEIYGGFIEFHIGDPLQIPVSLFQ